MPTQNTHALIALGVLVVIGLSVAGYLWIDQTTKAHTVAPFEERLTEFTSMTAPPTREFRDGDAKPGMITIDWKNRKVDYIYFDLPRELRAETPDDVETVAWLEWGEVREDEYEGGGWAIRYICTVTVFDLATKKAIAQQKCKGGEPPHYTTTPAGSNDYGSKPTAEIVSFLRSVV